MKITVDLEDFWAEDDESLSEALVDRVKESVLMQIRESIANKVDYEIKVKLEKVINETELSKIDGLVEAAYKKAKIRASEYDRDKGCNVSKEMTLEEYCLWDLEHNTGSWSNPKEFLKKLAKENAEKLKERYDLYFASQIVTKLADNGMLKDGAAQMLLDLEKNSK